MAKGPLEVSDELVSAALDRELSPDEQAVFDAALSADEHLRAEMEALGSLRRAVRRATPEPAVPASLATSLAGLLDAVDAERGTPASSPRPTFRRLVPTLAAAALLLVAVGLTAQRVGSSRQPEPLWAFNPASIAENHLYWHNHYRQHPARPGSPVDMARSLASQVGYAVRPPNPEALGARLVGCATCRHSFANGQPVAVFLMDRAGRDLSLFEVVAPATAVAAPAFAPASCHGVQVAEAGRVRLALVSQGDVHACLVGTDISATELANLAPHALRTACQQRQAPTRLALLTVPVNP